MSLIKDISCKIRNPARGLMPIPCLIVLIYGELCFLIHLHSMQLWDPFDYWSLPQHMGLSLLELFTWIHILLAAYLIVSLWAFAMEKSNRSFRTVSHWATYIVSFAILILLQVYIHHTDRIFGIPEEIVKLKTTEFHALAGRTPRDLILPESDLCEGFRNPDAKRFIIRITRKGHYIRNRHDLGHVDDVLDVIRYDLSTEAEEMSRNPEGPSTLILLIRADREVAFETVYKLMQVCADERLRINKVELNCFCDLNRKVPEAAKKMQFPYLAEGKLEVHLPLDADYGTDEISGCIKIEVFRKKSDEAGFYLVAHNQRFEGPGMLDDFQNMMKDLHDREPGLEARINAHENVWYSHVIDVFSECLRAGVDQVRFSSIKGQE